MTTRIERPLRAIAEVTLGRQRSPENDTGPHMVPYMRAANVKDGYVDLSDVKEMNFSPTEQLAFALRPGDVLVTEGAGSLAAVGASAVWNGEMRGTVCFQNTLLRLRPSGSTDPRFLAWWARHAYSSGLFGSIAGGANIYHLGAERVRSLLVWCPTTSVQWAIADFLERHTAQIHSLIAAKRRMIELLEERYQAALDAVFETLNAPQAALGRFAIGISQGVSPQAENRPAVNGEWGLLKLSSVKHGRFIPTENKALPPDFEIDRALAPRPGELLVTRSNTPAYVGDACAVVGNPGQVLLSDLIYRLRLDRRLLADFASAALLRAQARSHLSATARGTSQSMVKLRGEDVKATLIPVVGIDVQAQVTSKLRAARIVADEAILCLSRQTALLQERRHALITAAVTGQLDIPTAAA